MYLLTGSVLTPWVAASHRLVEAPGAGEAGAATGVAEVTGVTEGAVATTLATAVERTEGEDSLQHSTVEVEVAAVVTGEVAVVAGEIAEVAVEVAVVAVAIEKIKNCIILQFWKIKSRADT